MYAAKDGGKNRKALFRLSMYEAAALRYNLGTELPAALRDDQLVVHYQPILALDGRRIAGHEALVRWRHPLRGQLLPAEFLPVAEASGVMPELFRLTLGQALADFSEQRWLEQGFVCVNVSATQLECPRFLTDLKSALAQSGVPEERLILEIVETELMDGLISATTRLEAVRHLGVRVAIDDFGTGHSSLEHLVRLPADIIKIPRSLTTDTARDRRVIALLDAVRWPTSSTSWWWRRALRKRTSSGPWRRSASPMGRASCSAVRRRLRGRRQSRIKNGAARRPVVLRPDAFQGAGRRPPLWKHARRSA
jgi:EAL domain-containing protein (putative c-di-GMP-specific phosphodiesterase class I)